MNNREREREQSFIQYPTLSAISKFVFSSYLLSTRMSSGTGLILIRQKESQKARNHTITALFTKY